MCCCVACVAEYFSNENPNEMAKETSEDPIYKGYKAVLDSKSTDETLVLIIYLHFYILLLLFFFLLLRINKID